MSNSNKQQALPLKSALQQQLAAERLDGEQLQQLMQLQCELSPANNDAAETHVKASRRRFYRPALLASLLLLGLLTLLWQPLMHSGGDGRAREIAMEVVNNHLKLKPLDVKTQSMAEIQGFFTQLDFLPQSSRVLQQQFLLADTSMLGGRYCSIKGVTAAQLRYRLSGDAEAVSTLYQVGYDAELFGALPRADLGEPPRQLTLKGLTVSMWLERDLLMVLVSGQ